MLIYFFLMLYWFFCASALGFHFRYPHFTTNRHGCSNTLECIEQCFARQIVTDKLKHLNIWTLCRCQTLKKKVPTYVVHFPQDILMCCDWWEFSISRGFQTLSVQIPLTRDRRRGRNSKRVISPASYRRAKHDTILCYVWIKEKRIVFYVQEL